MKVVATITSKFGSRSYVQMPVSRIENYQIDSALDTDTDQFSIDIGDPDFELIDLLRRDEEVRIGLSAATHRSTLSPVLQGYGDTVVLRHDGSLSIQGRDLSSAAVDTTAQPYNWGNVNPRNQIIIPSARALGFARLNISPIKTINKLYTDGSESEWELWYRIVRKKQMWIWCSPDGTLNIDQLNYAARPTYYFGIPSSKYPNEGNWIRVKEAQITKNTQTRIGEVWVFGETGKVGFGPIKASDPSIKDWIKRPRRIITADTSKHTNRAEALKEANEEIFESIVGSLEISLTIADPGVLVRQNTTAIVNLPTMGYSGEFFVVGVQAYNGQEGAYQQVRLRERKYALTRRIPNDPTGADTSDSKSGYTIGTSLSLAKADWGQYFVNAAKDNHGGWDYDLFLATLLAICDKETHFSNEREIGGNHGGKEWAPPPNEGFGVANSPADIHHHGDVAAGGALASWRADFANSAGNPYNPFGREAGVGPMQLTDRGLKEKADNRVGIVDEYVGGRWHPEANIWVGAYALAQKLQGLPQTEANFWLGVERYNGAGPAAVSYMKEVKAAVTNSSTGWLNRVKQAETKAQTLPGNSTKTVAPQGGNKLAAGTPDTVLKMINFAERQLGKPYRLGGSGPNVWDCSGLVWGAYHAAGLDGQIGGRQTTWGYWANGTGWGNLQRIVEKADLLAGDMVFFDVPSETPPGHMGLYYGDGTMLVAPHTGDVVKWESISVVGMTFMGGMRLKGVWPQAQQTHPIGAGY